MELTDFLVCVRCFTFNQVSYIEDAMNGFCIQNTNIPYVCIIVDDASTDGEQEVIKSYLTQHFKQDDTGYVRKEETDDYIMSFAQHKTNSNCFFAVYFLKYNHYSIKKDKFSYFSEFHDSAKYVALCEGDDYWIKPWKLQTQVDFMETHPDYALCYTKSRRECKRKILGEWGDPDCSFEGLLNGCIIPTLTRLERISIYEQYMKEVNPLVHKWMMGDYSNVLYYSLKSKIACLDGVSGVYRVLEESASHSSDMDKLLNFYDSADDIRYFFIDNYVASAEERDNLKFMVKRNEVSYKLNQYTQRYMIKEAAELYRASFHVLPKMKRVKYWLETFSRIISPVFIFVFNIKQFIKNHIKKLYLSI